MRLVRKRAVVSMLMALALFSLLDLGPFWNALLFLIASALLLITSLDEEGRLSSLSLIVIASVIGYALPVLLFPDSLGGLSALAVGKMMQWACIGFIAFGIAYTLVLGSSKESNFSYERRRRQLALASFTLLTIGFLSAAAWCTSAFTYGIELTFIQGQAYSAGSETVRQVLSLLIDLKYGYILGYLMLGEVGRRGPLHKLLFYLVLVMAAIEIVSIGSKGAIMRLVVVFTIGSILARGQQLRLSRLMGGIFAALLTVLSFSVITEYREIIRSTYGSNSSVNMTYRYEAFKRAVSVSMQFDEDSRETEVDAEDVTSRFASGAMGLGWTLEFTDGVPPYENALNSFLVPVYAILPRFVIPEKPVFFNSAEFASRYFGWLYGGISISLPGSLYYAWGYFGLMLGMAAAGGCLAFLENKIRLYGIVAIKSTVCFTILLLHLMDVGAEFQPVITNLTRAVVLMLIIQLAWKLQVNLIYRTR